MRQKQFGKKINNWHRPLGPSQPHRRFRQHRHDVPMAWEEKEVSTDDFRIDDYWNCYDTCGCCRNRYEGDQEDLDRHELNRLLEEVFNPPLAPLFRKGWRTTATVEHKPQNMVNLDSQGHTVGTTLAQRLAEYLEEVVHCSQSSDWIRVCINEATGHSKNLEIVQRVAAQTQTPMLAQRLCLFAPFWLRRPDTWNETRACHQLATR